MRSEENPNIAQSIAVVLKGYPRLSETFIAQELHALEGRGLSLRIFSLRHPTDEATHPVHREIAAPVIYLPEYLKDDPRRVLKSWWQVRRRPGYGIAFRRWLSDLRRDPTANRVRRFGQACVLASELPDDVDQLYAHFLHTPASVTRYASLITGVPWSCSAHAKDIWTSPDWEKREKLEELDWLVTCTSYGHDHLAALATQPDKVSLVYHGLDFARLPEPQISRSNRDGSDPSDPIRLLSVGRLVEKKGYDVLLRALARLPKDLHWTLVHIGGGALRQTLQDQAQAAGLAPRISWLGAQAQEAVVTAYRQADIFVLASRVARDGDRDGLPNVLMEAQSQGLVCLSTQVAAVPELIEDGVNGILVPPDDDQSLAAALVNLIRDPALRHRLGQAGAHNVHQRFSHSQGIDRLVDLFASVAKSTADQKLLVE